MFPNRQMPTRQQQMKTPMTRQNNMINNNGKAMNATQMRPQINQGGNGTMGYIFFYDPLSDKCDKFHNELMRNHMNIYQRFQKVNINDRRIRLPSTLKTTPAIIIPDPQRGKNILKQGDEVFQWLDMLKEAKMREYESRYQGGGGPPSMQTNGGRPQPSGQGPNGGQRQQNSLMDFDPIAMGRGDNAFASLGDDSLTGDKSEMNGYALFQNNSNADYTLGVVPPTGMPSGGGGLGSAGMVGANGGSGDAGGGSSKEQEFKMKLDQLMAERDRQVAPPIQRQ